MYPRVDYEMTEDDLKKLMEACEPTPMIMLQTGSPPSQQESANNAWKRMGEKMGFDSMTVQPIAGKGTRFFSAVPSETESQKAERTNREKEEKRQTGIKTLKEEISERQTELKELEGVK